MTTPDLTPDPSLYDEAEWEMLQSFENADWLPEPDREARRARWPEAFREARHYGYTGPVPYDVPYPWAAKAADPPPAT